MKFEYSIVNGHERTTTHGSTVGSSDHMCDQIIWNDLRIDWNSFCPELRAFQPGKCPQTDGGLVVKVFFPNR